jgi:putative spermidine/putrescine transport system substrate-binding protein
MSSVLTRDFRRSAAALAVASLLLGARCAKAEDKPADGVPPSGTILSIASWGGAYQQAQTIAIFDPFTNKTGIAIKAESYDGTLAAIRDKIGASASAFDVVDLSSYALETLCRDGVLETLDSTMLTAPSSGPSASDDFLPGGITSCGIASVAWSTALAFDRQAFAKAQPAKIADLLDLQRFPGKRALPNGPRYTLELALLADGVEPADIYSTLATDAGADRAFAALDKIKAQILWWSKAEDAVAMLMQRKASIAAAFNGRLFRAAVGARQRIEELWDGQIYDLDLWAVAKGAAHKDDAKRFIAFATEPQQMAAQAALIAYGPMRKSAIPLVGKHPAIGIEMKGFLPTSPDNFKKALKFDEAWWKDHGAALESRFQTWREQPVSEAKPAPADAKSKPGDTKPVAADKTKAKDAKAATADDKPKPADAKSGPVEGQTHSVPQPAAKPSAN